MVHNAESPETDQVGSGPPETEDVHQANARMRYEWLAATFEMNEALREGDQVAAALARSRREVIQNDFVTRNRRLAMSAAKDFLAYARGDLNGEYEQAAVLGMWEAFAGTDPERINNVLRRDDDTLVGEIGWDPSRSTFGGFSRVYIRGSVQRAVAGSESGLSYAMWTHRPKVTAVRNRLAESLGREPSNKEIAAATGLPMDTIRAVLTPSSVSTATELGDGFTLGDTLADTEAGHALSADDADLLNEWLVDVAKDIKPIPLFSLLLRKGLTGAAQLPVVDVAARLGVGRGTVQAGTTKAADAVLAHAAASPEIERLRRLAATHDLDVDASHLKGVLASA